MKLLIYSHGFPNPAEPQRSVFVKEIIRFLPPDIEVTVVAPVPFFLSRRRQQAGLAIPLRRIEPIGDRGVDIHHPRYPLLPRYFLKPLIGWLEGLFTYRCVKSVRDTAGIDLIHVNWGYPDGVAVRLLARLLRLPYVITEHQGSIGELLAKPFYNQLLGRVYRGSRRLIVVSEGMLQPLHGLSGKLSPLVVYNGIDLARFTLAQKRNQPQRLLFIGNLIPAKGVHRLIQALALLRDQGRDFSLDIVGAGSQKRELEAQVKALRLSGSVSFLGVIDSARIPRLLNDYDALVLPTLAESFGIVLIEAMAAGLPVISTCCGGPQHIVSPEVGILVQPDSAEALAEGIALLERNWADYDPQTIRAYCQRRFDIRHSCEQLATVYREALTDAVDK